MKQHIAIAVALGALLNAYPASAQDSQPVSFAIYYHCDQSREARTDTIVQQVLAPIFDRHVSAGHVMAWGWLAHHAGGHWRRLAYYVASDRDVLLDTRDQIIEEVGRDHAAALQELTAICPTHDDYIWTSVASSQPASEVGQARPPAGFSTYYECDISREARADTLVTEVFAPIFNRHVSEGQLDSWSWLSHIVGGKWRRLGVFNASEHNTILNVRDQIIEEIGNKHPAAGREFGEICTAHQDYMWDIRIARP